MVEETKSLGTESFEPTIESWKPVQVSAEEIANKTNVSLPIDQIRPKTIEPL